MTTAQVVETSVTVTNSSFQNYTHPDDHTRQTTNTPGFKPFTKSEHSLSLVPEHQFGQQALAPDTVLGHRAPGN